MNTTSQELPLVMYVVINEELNMSPGKIASQVGHVVQIIVDELVTQIYEDPNATDNDHCLNYLKWKDIPTKIILRASGYRFNKLLELSTARYFTDTGKTTQGTENKITAIGFLPCNNLKSLFSTYNLVQ